MVLNTGETEILLTNISKEIIDTEKMKEVYFKRWGIEKSYDILKNKLQIENFSGYSKLAVEQDFYAQILLFNMLEDIKKQANKKIKDNRENNGKIYKYEYIVNINILVGLLKQYLLLMALTDSNDEYIRLQNTLLELMNKNLIAIKHGRNYIRKKRDTRNKYKTNMRRSI